MYGTQFSDLTFWETTIESMSHHFGLTAIFVAQNNAKAHFKRRTRKIDARKEVLLITRKDTIIFLLYSNNNRTVSSG